jgi:hypothetical protein
MLRLTLPRNRLIIIGTALDPAALREALSACCV